jgi:hypothetical protein
MRGLHFVVADRQLNSLRVGMRWIVKTIVITADA